MKFTRMKRKLIGLVPWMGLFTIAAAAQVRSADVIYTHFSATPVSAYRLGDECFVPVDSLSSWGWQSHVVAGQNDASSEDGQLDIQAEGKDFKAPIRKISDRSTVPMSLVVKQLGGGSEWVPEQDTFDVYSTLDSIAFHSAMLKVRAPLAIEPWSRVFTNPNRLVIDLAGARLSADTKLDLESTVHVSQYKRDVVRIVIDTQFLPTPLPLSATAPATEFAFDASPPAESAGSPVASAPEATQVPVGVAPAPLPVHPSLSIKVLTDTQTESRISMQIPLTSDVHPEFDKPDPSTLEIVLHRVHLDLNADSLLSTSSISNVVARYRGDDTVVTFALPRPMGAAIASQVTSTGQTVVVDLMKPNVGDGHLARKIVVVDPGHGGKDLGAHCYGAQEKDLNLVIGKLLADRLAAEGATVILTRSTDTFIPLATRAAIANDNHADFFVSCHINSTGDSRPYSGGITFHHLGKSVSRLLAECIQSEIAHVSELPNLGVWSDAKIWKSGFSVLRNTHMPGVLLELGFINNPRDCHRICQPGFQASVAEAVVKGLKDFLGDVKTN